MATFTVQFPLREPSERKKERLRETMDRQQEIAQKIAELMQSIPSSRWGNAKSDSVYHRWVEKHFPENNSLRSHDANQVAYKVSSNFQSWKSNGYGDQPPQYENHAWARFCNCSKAVEYDENSGSWGVRLPLEPYNGEWLSLNIGEYQEQFLEKERNGKARFGDAELKEYSHGYVLNQSVTIETEISDYEPETFIGVDLGLSDIAVAVAWQPEDGVQEVEFFSGDKVAHHRRELRETRSELQEAGQLGKVKELKGLEQRFCQQRNHEVSKKIVELASQYEKPVIVLEELSGIRQRLKDLKGRKEFKAQLSSWTFGELQGMIEYKAEREEIKTEKVDPKYTSQKCNKCGEKGRRPYKGNTKRFYCPDCDYEVDADFNAAVNIAVKRSSETSDQQLS